MQWGITPGTLTGYTTVTFTNKIAHNVKMTFAASLVKNCMTLFIYTLWITLVVFH